MRLTLALLLAALLLVPLAVLLLQRAPWSLRAEFDREVAARHPWSTPLRENATFEGGRVARRGQAAWGLPAGEFTSGELVLESLRTDPAPAPGPARGG